MKKITLLFLAVFAFSLFANAQDPVLRYTFDDVITNSGTVGAAGDLTVQQGGTAAYVTGKFDNGYDGTGSNSLASTYAGITGHAARTITGWVKLPDIDNKAMIVELGRRTSGTNGERFSVLFAST